MKGQPQWRQPTAFSAVRQSVSITFTLAFPSTAYVALFTGKDTQNEVAYDEDNIGVSSLTRTGCTIYLGSSYIAGLWVFAVGV